MSTSRRILAVGAAGALALSTLVAGPATAGGGHHHHHKPSPERFADRISTQDVWRHLEAFQRIADRHDGNRAALTPGYEASARYVERTLRRAGYRTWRDEFTFEREVVDTAALTVGDAQYPLDQMQYSPNAPDEGVTGSLAAPTDPLGCVAEDWAGFPAGSIALVSRGACPFADKAVNAEAAGAVGAIVYNNEEGMLNGTLGTEGLVAIPVAGMTQADGTALAADLGALPEATMDLRSHTEEATSFNVLAETRKGRDDNVVMLGAHLDGVEEGAGINDNATGSAALLAVATELARTGKHNNTVRFAWWGAEELGLIGSTEYVAELAEQEGELDRIATYLNFDMIGSPNYIIGVYDADQSTYPAPGPVPEGSAETEQVFTDYFDKIGQPWVDSQFSGRSDYQAFIVNGVPASGLFTGADGSKTEEEVALFGGTPGIQYDPNYHTAADDISNVDAEALTIMSKAIAYATYSLAQDTSAINGVSGPGKGHGKPGRPGKGKGHGKGWGKGHGKGWGWGHDGRPAGPMAHLGDAA